MPTPEWPVGRLRLILPLAFGALLLLMLTAGFSAIQTLRQLHSEEEAVRKTLADRGQSLSALCASIDLYGDRIQRFLMTDQADAAVPSEFAQLDAEIDGVFRAFAGSAAPEEREMIDSLERLFADERRMFRSAAGMSAIERRRQGPRMLVDEVLPRGEEVLSMYQRITVWNTQRLGESDTRLLGKFGELQGDLGRLLLVTLGAALMLSVASAFYTLGLERRGRMQYAELAHSKSELEKLSSRLVDAQENERRAISRELHDEVGQLLSAALVDIGRLSTLVPAENPQAREYVTRVKSTTEKTVRTVRDIALLLRPSMLDDLGLVAALEWQGREISRHSEMEVDVRAHNVSDDLPDEYRVCIYRLVQEALNNAAKHSGARNARVTVDQKPAGIDVQIRDDGRGFDASRTRGVGILGMEERVRRLGGSLQLESESVRGTAVCAHLPLPGGAAS